MVTQSIIVYRNPLEAALWESLSESTVVGSVAISAGAFIVSLIALTWAFDVVMKHWPILRRSDFRKYWTNISLVLAAVFAVFIYRVIAL